MTSPPGAASSLVGALAEAERLALTYAPAKVREQLLAGFSLDAALRQAALGKSEALLAQVRLAWWRDACARIPEAADHPVLVALGKVWRGPSDPLIALVDAWEAVAVATDRFVDAAAELATARAAVIASLTGALADESVTVAAHSWTLATLADFAPNGDTRELMRSAAATMSLRRLPRALRPLAVLHGLARRAAAAGGSSLLGDRASPFVAMRLGIFGC